jgi:hypothetical protein
MPKQADIALQVTSCGEIGVSVSLKRGGGSKGEMVFYLPDRTRGYEHDLLCRQRGYLEAI